MYKNVVKHLSQLRRFEAPKFGNLFLFFKQFLWQKGKTKQPCAPRTLSSSASGTTALILTHG